jgi:hypothetical protein
VTASAIDTKLVVVLPRRITVDGRRLRAIARAGAMVVICVLSLTMLRGWGHPPVDWVAIAARTEAQHRADVGVVRVAGASMRRTLLLESIVEEIAAAVTVRDQSSAKVDTSALAAAVATLEALDESTLNAWQIATVRWDAGIPDLVADVEARVAAFEAAEAARLAALAQRTSGGSSSGPYAEYVVGAGGQALIDACQGSVLFGHGYPLLIAEHWSCGGSAFPRRAGALVDFSGALGGRYVVVGLAVTVDGSVATSADLPQGYDLLYQTCLRGDVRQTQVWALNRIE